MKPHPCPKKINLEGKELLCFAEVVGAETWVSIEGWTYKLPNTGVNRLKKKYSSTGGSGEICAPMPGQILKVLVKNGDSVDEGASLFIVEAMKMEHTLKAPYSGTVTDLNFKDGDTVSGRDIILKIISGEQ